MAQQFLGRIDDVGLGQLQVLDLGLGGGLVSPPASLDPHYQGKLTSSALASSPSAVACKGVRAGLLFSCLQRQFT